MKVEVSTTQFEFSHGRAPRGEGQWAFAVEDFAGADPFLAKTFWFLGSYSAAKAAAVKFAREQGAARVAVLP